MGMIGIMLLLAAISHGLTIGGFALGGAGLILTGLGYRFGFCPSCTIACFLAAQTK